jgi:glycosyltransferase involved in cell wall biosynthesis
MSRRLFRMKNEDGRAAALEKAIHLGWGLLKRILVLLSVPRYDAIWIHREAFPFFTPWPERLVRHLSRGRVVLDFDDALYVPPPGGRDWRSRLRRADEFRSVVTMADVVLAGSPLLVSWANSVGVTAQLVPTCVQIPLQLPERSIDGQEATIGWIGSWSTARSLVGLADVLRGVHERTGARVVLVGADNLAAVARMIPGATWRRWKLDRETDDLDNFDIGIMPLEDTPWNRGKCAYKLIQYMAHGIPFVASPVGMNTDIAISSEAGLLAATTDEWTDALTELVADRTLRARLGSAGRRYAIDHFDRQLYEADILHAVAG